jgi:phosphohistidine phosphatase SixA
MGGTRWTGRVLRATSRSMATSSISRRGILGAMTLTAFGPRAGAAEAAAFARPGVHALMRHARAPGTGDPPGFRLDDASTQRNLDAGGRAQARAAGALLRATGARFDPVLSSAWARCVETATLMEMGPVRVEPAFNSFFEDRSEGPTRSAAALALLRALPKQAKALVVTHQVNIAALTRTAAASGEIIAVRIAPDGTLQTLARMRVPLG